MIGVTGYEFARRAADYRPHEKPTTDHRPPQKNPQPTRILETWQKCGKQQFIFSTALVDIF